MNTVNKIYSEAEFQAAVHQARIDTHKGICEHINAAHAAHNAAISQINAAHELERAAWARKMESERAAIHAEYAISLKVEDEQ